MAITLNYGHIKAAASSKNRPAIFNKLLSLKFLIKGKIDAMLRKSKVLRIFWRYWMEYPKLFFSSLLMGPLSAVQYVVTPLFVALGLSELIRTHHVDINIMIWA